jgi:serine/threonine protein phosphatase 1
MDYCAALPRRVVHGHTIVGDAPVVTSNRISIDTGAYRSGILTAAVLDVGGPRFLATSGAPDKNAIVREAMLVA